MIRKAESANETAQLAATKSVHESRMKARVTSFSPHPTLPVMVTPRYNGQVVVFNTKGDGVNTVLYSDHDTQPLPRIGLTGDLVALKHGPSKVWSVGGAFTQLNKLLVEFPAEGHVTAV